MRKILSVLIAIIMVIGAFTALSFTGGAQEFDAASAGAGNRLNVTLQDAQTGYPSDYDVQRSFEVGSVFTVYTYLDVSTLGQERVAAVSAEQKFDSAYLELMGTDSAEESRSFLDRSAVFPITKSIVICNLDIKNYIYYNYSHTRGLKFNEKTRVLSAFTYRVIAGGSTAVVNNVNTVALGDAQLTRAIDESDVKEKDIFLYTTFAAQDQLEEAMTYPALGDVNGDGKLDITDATVIQKQQAMMPIPVTVSDVIADADENGSVNIQDVSFIQRSLARLRSNDTIGHRIA